VLARVDRPGEAVTEHRQRPAARGQRGGVRLGGEAGDDRDAGAGERGGGAPASRSASAKLWTLPPVAACR
jgi:hypothetical protein